MVQEKPGTIMRESGLVYEVCKPGGCISSPTTAIIIPVASLEQGNQLGVAVSRQLQPPTGERMIAPMRRFARAPGHTRST